MYTNTAHSFLNSLTAGEFCVCQRLYTCLLKWHLLTRFLLINTFLRNKISSLESLQACNCRIFTKTHEKHCSNYCWHCQTQNTHTETPTSTFLSSRQEISRHSFHETLLIKIILVCSFAAGWEAEVGISVSVQMTICKHSGGHLMSRTW